MIDFVEYVTSELKSKRLAKAGALELMRQFFEPAHCPRLHPLVHRNCSTLTQQSYRTRFSGAEFFLRDHRVRLPNGKSAPVLPGVAYLEMARAAIADAVPDMVVASLVTFEDVLWLAPLFVENECDICIEIDTDADCLSFRISSEDAAAQRTLHATGRARFLEPHEFAALNVADLREQMRRERWDSPAVYAMYSQVGIEYGPAHRGIVQLHRGEGQVLAELALPAALAEDRAAYLLHPALLDGALQAAIGLGERDALPAQPLLPFALDSLCVVRSCADRLHALIRRASPAEGVSEQLSLDLDLCDGDGNVCVQMRGFRARRLEARSVETLIAVPEWNDYRECEAISAVTRFEQRRVLLCDRPDIDVAVLMLGDTSTAAVGCSAGVDPAARYEAAALQVLEQVQDLLRNPRGATALLQCVIPDTAEGLLLGGLGALLKTAVLESPSLVAQLLIIDAQTTASQLTERLAHAGTHREAATIQYCGGQWRSLDWKLLPRWLEAGTEQPYKEDGVYVVTGGLGGLGRIVMHDILSRTQRAQVVLTGRAPLDDRIRTTLAAAGGTRLHYRALDLDDSGLCASTLEDIRNSIGKVRGIFHCAGTRSDQPIVAKTADDMVRVLRPKVRGTWNLDAATANADLDFFVLFSSGVAVFGNAGQADYAAANGFMDAFAHHRERLTSQGLRRGRTVSIDWPLWQDGGMQPNAESLTWLQRQTGMTPMRSASGLTVLYRALASRYAQVLTVEGNGAKLRSLFEVPAMPAASQSHTQPPAPVNAATPAAGAGDLLARTREFLRREFAPLLKIAASQIDIHETLDGYGINSILAMNLTTQLEKHFGPLQKTLFFEYQTIAALSEHFVQAHEARLQAMLAPASGRAAASVSSVVVPMRDAPRGGSRKPAGGKSLPALSGAPRAGAAANAEPIAIVGLSGRYPEAETIEDYWRNLRDGKDCISEIPSDRWRWQDYYTDDRSQRGHYSKWGGFIAGVDEFDPQFFNISPREAPYIDPQERLFLQHAWMAIEDAGYTRKRLQIPRAHGLAGQVGVYVGVMYGEYNASGSLASIANRVSYVLNLHGPSMTLDTMCSSSLTAIHLACQDLRSGATDLAIAGGVNVSVHPGKYTMLSAGQFISSDGHCQSFGEGGDGYIPGEGVGALVLKRLSEAQADGDAIHAIIRGSALNHGGKTNGYTVPNPQAQAAAIAQAFTAAGVNARQVSYIEAHGTGTKLGDPIEIAALDKAFREHTPDTQFCWLGSAKSNIGHCESAAGVAGLTKVILQLRHRQIVPSLHSQRLNPNIAFERSAFVVNQQLRDWESPIVDGRPAPRIAGLSSFGAGGANAHFVIEEYGADEVAQVAMGSVPTVVPLSARNPEQLRRKAEDLLSFLGASGEAGKRVDLAALAYTLQVGREAMEERLGLVVDSVTGLQDALRNYLGGAASGVFRANVREHKETLALFAADSEFEETLNKWIACAKLTKLAELWVKGIELDWRKFHGVREPRRVHLPAYPFAKEKYWIDPIKGLFGEAAPERAPAAQPRAIAPLAIAPLAIAPLMIAAEAAPLKKPSGVALAALTALSVTAAVALAKPSASPLLVLDGAAPVREPAQRNSAPVAAVAAVPQTEAAPRREDLRAYLKRSLAQALYLDEASIDEQRSFVDFGLDSIVGVEWVKRFNKDLGLNVGATRVYDFPTVATLAAYLETQPRVGATAAPPPSIPAPVKVETETETKTVTAQALPAIEPLRVELRRSLAQALYLDETAIDDDKPFVDFGLDSIVGVEWVKAINKNYGLEISATRVYDYSNIRALAGFVHAELTKLPAAPSVPARAAEPLAEPRLTGPTPERKATAAEKIAIVGVSGRYPGADNLSQFWRNLVEGRNSIQEIPAGRWDVDTYYDPTPGKPGKVYCKWLGVLDGADQFDPLFFQISPSEAELMDPQHRLFMQESFRAFEDAGYSSAALSNTKCGVYLGIMSNEYSFLLARSNAINVETTGNSFAIGAARIAYHLNLKGPAIPIDTACSSSLVAIHLACQALLNHEIDMGLAGGVSLYLIPESYVGMCRAGMLSRDGQCKTFDNGADGFVPGEGVGTVVLKRLSDAERDGDEIYGVIIGSGINQDGKTNGITAPSVNSQIELERDIYRKYQIDASSISYVETHGTGTKLGDPIELEALATVFKEYTGQRHFCALGAVKTNIGHTSGAAGVASVHKVLLCLQHAKLVPNLNITRENALFDFENSPFYFSKSVRDWTVAPGSKRRAAVSAFGFSGTNAHIVIEEYTAAPRDARAPQTCIVPLSARSAAQLQTRAQDLLEHLAQAGSAITLRDLAYTLQTGREPMRERCAWVVDSIAELQSKLRAFADGDAGDVGHRGSVARAQDNAPLTQEWASAQRQGGLQQSAHVAALWAKGAEVDWPSFYVGARPRRVHLPTYPFVRDRYWVQPSTAPASEPLPELIDDKQPALYAPVWRASVLPPRQAPLGHEDTLLILDTDERLYQQIVARLQAPVRLKAIVLVQLGHAYGQQGDDHFIVDARKPEHFVALLDALRAQGKTPTRVIHNVNAARLLPDDGDGALERALQIGIDGLFALCKALAGGRVQQSPCAFVSFFHTADSANTALGAALAAFYPSLALENNRYHGRVLEIDHERIDAERSAIDTVSCVIDELQSRASRDIAIRYRAVAAAPTQRFARALAAQPPGQPGLAELPLKHRGVYLITGGLGGLGYLFSRHLAARYRAKLVLSGRSALTDDLEQKIAGLRALGADVLYLPADIADAEQAGRLIARAKTHFGAVNGVLHSAGIHRDALLIKKEGESLRQVLAPKVAGTLNLDRLTAAEPLDLFVLFSSGAGSFGNAGQTDYAYANAFMDAFAERRESWRGQRQRFGKTLSIAWPFWQDGGMHVPAADLKRIEQLTGICALPTDVGIACWETLLRSSLTRALALYGHPSKIAEYCAPSEDPAFEAGQPAREDGVGGDSLYIEETEQYLCQMVHRETKIPLAQIDVNERFEAFGFDSVMIGRFNAALERDLGDLPKTLLYEYETVAELAAYLCATAQAALGRRSQLDAAALTSAPVQDSPPVAAPIAVSVEMPAAVEVLAPQAAEPIAIIGVHASLPQADDLHEYWEHLKAGRELIQLVPPNRWNHADFYDADPAQAERGKIYCKWGGFLDDFDKFDAAFFNIPAAEAKVIDPQERRFLQSAWAALEDAGYTRELLKRQHAKRKSADVGVFVGVTTNSYQLLAPEAWQRGEMVTPSAMPWSIANRVSYYFDFQGPSMPVDTACSSSLVAVHLACESLRRRECQVALAGGVNLYLHPAKYHSFCQRRMLAAAGHCCSYGAGDDGFIPGEGVGTLVLKPLGAAERDRDHIYGVIRASAFDHSGRSNAYAAPNPNAQAQVIGQVLANANIPARSITFIEGHGTGTQMGDSLEIAAITQAFRRETTDPQFCALGSVKANLGHAESATSIAGIAKILLQFKHRQIAPSINAEVMNPDADFARSPCYLQTRLIPWPAPGDSPRRALINAFGAGGVNACAALEEYVPASPLASQSGSCLFVLSAKNADRLREYAARYVSFLDREPQSDIASLCYTAQVGREAMPERLALLVDSTAQLRESLSRWLEATGTRPQSSERLWCGSLDPQRASRRATQAQREQVESLCTARALPALAQLWVQGGDVDWQRLYAGQLPYRVALPSYPFARDRHWITDGVPRSPARTTPAPSRLHPLISYNSSTLKQVSFDAVLADDEYYACHHKIQGRAVFPGAGFIEMACVAATMAGQQRVRQVKDIVWAQPLAFAGGSSLVQIRLAKAIGDGTEFGVVSFDGENDSVAHCEGRLVFHDAVASEPPVAPSFAQWQQRCRRRHGSEEYYQRFARLGFEYGPAFRVIEELSVGEGCALATLRLATAQAADFEQYLLHPCLIDGALQTVIALLAADDQAGTCLPFAIEEIEIIAALTPRCYALVEKAGDERSYHANILRFNIHILSEGGEPLVRITNFHVRALPAETPAHAAITQD